MRMSRGVNRTGLGVVQAKEAFALEAKCKGGVVAKNGVIKISNI